MDLVRLRILFSVIVVAAAGCNSCREEPTIVIRFEPSDADIKVLPPASSPSPTPSPSPTTVSPPSKSAKKECRAAADCVVVPEECCDCANGGKQHAIPKAKQAAAKAARAAECKHRMCTMMMSTDPTCGMRADCVAGQCVMVKK